MTEKTKSTETEEQGPKPGEQVAAPELLAEADDAAKPAAVQNGRIHATYLGLGLERDKNNEKLVHLDFSFALQSGIHDGLIPEKAKDAWYYLQASGDIAVKINGIPPCTLDVYRNPSDKKAQLHLMGASFSKATVQVIEEVGKGKTIKVTRFAFRLLVERTEEVIEFAAWRDSEDFWITIPATQRKMAATA